MSRAVGVDGRTHNGRQGGAMIFTYDEQSRFAFAARTEKTWKTRKEKKWE